MDRSFSVETRAADLLAMSARPVDVLVIGGGITGAGVARDAAMRGLRVALIEARDFASGTSGHSSRLIHGGLRYLEMGDLHLVFEASRERRILLSIAPHLVRPRSFLFPVFRGSRVPRWKLSAGLWLYDALALFRNVRSHHALSKQELLRVEPGLRESDLLGGARYYDAQCDDARLTLSNVRDAHRHGALVANYARVEHLDVVDGRVRGARVRDAESDRTFAVTARVTVNATGPWSDAFRGSRGTGPLLRTTKGTHVVVPRHRVGNSEAITLTSPVDGRVMFIIPWGALTYIGTTDTDSAETPDEVRPSAEDIVYLLRSANALFPRARLGATDIVSAWSGLRPLLRPADPRHPSSVSREHRIVSGPWGLISVVGGKLTTYRSMAAEAVDLVVNEIRGLDGSPSRQPASTDKTPLPGGEVADLSLLRAEVEREGASSDAATYLVELYGSEAVAVQRLRRSRPEYNRPIVPDHAAHGGDFVHAVGREMALSLMDLLVRRTHVFYEARGQGVQAAEPLANLIGDELGWDQARRAEEVAKYRQFVDAENAFRADLVGREV